MENRRAAIGGMIPALGGMKQFKRFLSSSFPVGVIMNLHLALLDGVFSSAKAAEKELLVHMDMIHGLSGDEYGAEYICGKYRPLAAISIRPSVILACKRLGVTAIQRVFLIDTLALNRSIEAVGKAKPDYVEVLPGMCLPLFPMLRSKLNKPLIAGGLIPSKAEAEQILKQNVSAVTISIDRLLD